MVLPFIVNTTRQSPDRNRIPAAPLSAFTSPTPVSAYAFNFWSICARVVAVSLRHWRTAADREFDLLHEPSSSHNAITQSTKNRILGYTERIGSAGRANWNGKQRIAQDLVFLLLAQ
jgi:hypothetical protein